MALAIREPPPAIAAALDHASSVTGISPQLLRAVAWVESRYSRKSVSGKGALGLMQLMPATAADYGVADPFDANANALGGARMLAALYAQLGSWDAVFAAYNWGIGHVRTHPTSAQWPQQVRDYVSAINRAWLFFDPSSPGSVLPARARAGNTGAALGIVLIAACAVGFLALRSRGGADGMLAM